MDNYKKYLAFYWYIIKPYIWQQLIVFTIWLLHTSFTLVSPYLTKILIDYVLGEKKLTYLYIFIAANISLFLIKLITEFIQGVVSTKLSYKLLFDLQYKLHNHILHKDMDFFTKLKPGEILSRIANETGEILNLFNTTLMRIVIQVYSFITVTLIMFSINVKFTLIALVSVPLIVVNFSFFNKKFREQNREIMNAKGILVNILQENINSIYTTKIYDAYDYVSDRFKVSINKYVRKQFKLLYTTLYNNITMSTIETVPNILLLYFGGSAVIMGTMSLGDLIAITSYISMLFQPISSLSSLNVQLQKTFVAFKRYYEIYKDALINEETKKHSIKKVDRITSIEFKNVSFSYNDKLNIIDDLSFTVKRGDFVIITGENGTGKTTLFNLLANIYKPTEGHIYINGIDIIKIDRNSFINKVGLVTQNIFLFRDTIANNIILGRKNISKNYLMDLAKKLSFYNFILELKEQFETLILENGSNFSGGQKQKIGILRCLINKPDLILLDEPTSSLDLNSRKKFIDYLNSIKDEKIIFMITHDKSLLNLATKFIDLDEIKKSQSLVLNIKSI